MVKNYEFEEFKDIIKQKKQAWKDYCDSSKTPEERYAARDEYDRLIIEEFDDMTSYDSFTFKFEEVFEVLKKYFKSIGKKICFADKEIDENLTIYVDGKSYKIMENRYADVSRYGILYGLFTLTRTNDGLSKLIDDYPEVEEVLWKMVQDNVNFDNNYKIKQLNKKLNILETKKEKVASATYIQKLIEKLEKQALAKQKKELEKIEQQKHKLSRELFDTTEKIDQVECYVQGRIR